MEGAAPAADGLVRPHLVGLTVYKMTGSGNDFVMLDGRTSRPEDWSAADMQAVCARGTGIGADGVVFVSPGSHAGAVRMIYYNADGSHAAMCGNAALCSTTLAITLGLGASGGMDLETDAGTYRSRAAAGANGRSELHLAPVAAPKAVTGLQLAAGERQAVLGIVGVPHLVVLVDDVENVPLAERGRSLRFDPALAPAGANVNFISKAPDGSSWLMRTYERGVEAETLACGTGAVAAGCAIQDWGLDQLPIDIRTRSGRILGIRATRTETGQFDNVWLIGEGRMVFRGVLT